MAESTSPHSPPAHAALATVFQVRDDELQVLLWERAREPFRGDWSLPGGSLGPDETLEESILRHLARRSTYARSPTSSSSAPGATRRVIRSTGSSRPRTSASSRSASTRACPRTRAGTRSTRCHATAFDHGAIVLAGRERLRGKLSYSNVGFALAPETFTLAELRDIYAAALGYDVSATNLKRVLLRRGAIETTGRAAHTRSWRAAGRRRSSASGGAASRSPIRSQFFARPRKAFAFGGFRRYSSVQFATR